MEASTKIGKFMATKVELIWQYRVVKILILEISHEHSARTTADLTKAKLFTHLPSMGCSHLLLKSYSSANVSPRFLSKEGTSLTPLWSLLFRLAWLSPTPSRGHTLGLLSNSAWVYAFSHYPAEGQIVYCSPINHKPRIHMRKTTSWLCKDPHILTDGVLKVQPK